MKKKGEYRKLAAGLAREAGRLIMSLAGNPAGARCKRDGSPVTEADILAHRIIAAGLRETPWPVVSEESRSLAEQVVRSADHRYYWLVDPLDGTHGFLRNDGEFTVNIALVDGGAPLLGVVYQPSGEKLYWAARGSGSWLEAGGADQERLPLKHREINPSAPGTAVLTRAGISGRMRQFLQKNGIGRIIQCSSSIKLCMVAEGRADIYPRFGATSLWDTAAGAVIAREAGCLAKDLNGVDLTYDCAGGLLHNGFVVYNPARIEPVL